MKKKFNTFIKSLDLGWELVKDLLIILGGAAVQALALRLFLVPTDLVVGGVTGVAQILYHFIHTPIGLVTLLGNIPLFLIGWRYLGGPRFVIRTIWAIVATSLITDLLIRFSGVDPISSDILLNTLFGGVLFGVGMGVVYLGKGTSGGTDILGKVLNKRWGMSLSTAYMITDALVVLAAGFVWGWDNALYALVVIYLSGVAVDTVSQGVSVVRVVMIFTKELELVNQAIITKLERGTTILSAKGGYTLEERPVLYCVLARSEVSLLKAIVHEADPDAFLVIGHANEALGYGFKPLKDG